MLSISSIKSTFVDTCSYKLMATSQCCENPPTLDPVYGKGHVVDDLGGLKTYTTGSPESKLAILLISDIFGILLYFLFIYFIPLAFIFFFFNFFFFLTIFYFGIYNLKKVSLPFSPQKYVNCEGIKGACYLLSRAI